MLESALAEVNRVVTGELLSSVFGTSLSWLS